MSTDTGAQQPPQSGRSSPTTLGNNRAARFELLVMSEAGKPIYSYSKRDDAVTLMPLCSTLINFAQKAQRDTLKSIRTQDNLVVEFHTRQPLIIVVIYELNSFLDPMLIVGQVEAQIVSIVTAKTLRSIFQERPTFDLKPLLHGSERFIDSHLSMLCHEPINSHWPLVKAFLTLTSSTPTIAPSKTLVPVAIMQSSVRDSIHNIVSQAVSSKSKSIVFSLLFKVVSNGKKHHGEDEAATAQTSDDDLASINSQLSGNTDTPGRDQAGHSKSFQLITVCNHHNKHKLKIADIHLIYCLLDASRAQLTSVDSLWMPVCLPNFNEDAFSHSYISFTNSMSQCLIMFSVDRDEFVPCQSARNEIEDKLELLLGDTNQRNKFDYTISPLVHPVLLELQDKLISKSLTSDEMAEVRQQNQIYNSKIELYNSRQLQFLWYQTNKQVLWWQRSASKPLSRMVFYLAKKMLHSPFKTLWIKFAEDAAFLGWHVPTFQLYAQFDNTISTHEATEVIQRITNWIKKEEDNFSVKDYR